MRKSTVHALIVAHLERSEGLHDDRRVSTILEFFFHHDAWLAPSTESPSCLEPERPESPKPVNFQRVLPSPGLQEAKRT